MSIKHEASCIRNKWGEAGDVFIKHLQHSDFWGCLGRFQKSCRYLWTSLLRSSLKRCVARPVISLGLENAGVE